MQHKTDRKNLERKKIDSGLHSTTAQR